MNSPGMFASTIVASIVFLLTRHFISWSEAELLQKGIVTIHEGVRVWGSDAGFLKYLNEAGILGWTGSGSDTKLAFTRLTTIAAPLLTGLISGVIGSLVTKAPKHEVLDRFFKKIYVPIGQEEKLELPLDEAVPASKRWFTARGLFIVKPSRQSWVGFVITLAICLACVLVMLAILR